MKPLFMLSFCDHTAPRGFQFLGACIVEGDDTGDLPRDLAVAVMWSHMAGCNPGGSIASALFPPELAVRVRREWRDRLLTRADVEALNRELTLN